MRGKVMMLTVGLAGSLCAAQRIGVSLREMDAVGESVVANAKREAEAVFLSAGIQIVWRECGEVRSKAEGAGDPCFVVRVWDATSPRTVPPGHPASLDVMGKAFVPEGGGFGSLADAYLRSIREVAGRQGAEAGVLLGFVVTHELGHLLLGPDHAEDGVMRAAWGRKEIDQLQHRWLKFNEQGAARIRRELEARTGTPVVQAVR